MCAFILRFISLLLKLSQVMFIAAIIITENTIGPQKSAATLLLLSEVAGAAVVSRASPSYPKREKGLVKCL